MRVGINARLLASSDLRGFNRYTAELARALAATGRVEPVLFADRPVHPAHRLEGLRAVVAPVTPHVRWQHVWLPSALRRERVEQRMRSRAEVERAGEDRRRALEGARPGTRIESAEAGNDETAACRRVDVGLVAGFRSKPQEIRRGLGLEAGAAMSDQRNRQPARLSHEREMGARRRSPPRASNLLRLRRAFPQQRRYRPPVTEAMALGQRGGGCQCGTGRGG